MYSYDRRVAARPIPLDRSLVQKLVRDIQKELPRHLKFRGDPTKPLWTQRGFNPNNWGFELDKLLLQDVRGHAVRVDVVIGSGKISDWRSPRRFVKGGGVRSEFYQDSKYGYKTRLTIDFNSERSPQELQESPLVAKELTSVVSHEMTHLRDLLKRQGPVEDSDEGTRSYYNRPDEVRAFMRQVSDEVIEYAHKVGQDDPFFLNLDRHFMDQALRSSATWERVQELLTDSNRRLMLRGVTRALQDEWPKLQELYPQDEDDF